MVGTAPASGTLAAVGQFTLHGLSMGLVIMLLTLGMALIKGAVAGAYIIFCWLTLSELL